MCSALLTLVRLCFFIHVHYLRIRPAIAAYSLVNRGGFIFDSAAAVLNRNSHICDLHMYVHVMCCVTTSTYIVVHNTCVPQVTYVLFSAVIYPRLCLAIVGGNIIFHVYCCYTVIQLVKTFRQLDMLSVFV